MKTLIPHSIFHDTLKNSYIQFSHVQQGDNAFIAGVFPTFQHVQMRSTSTEANVNASRLAYLPVTVRNLKK